jgi:hypothetical protein
MFGNVCEECGAALAQGDGHQAGYLTYCRACAERLGLLACPHQPCQDCREPILCGQRLRLFNDYLIAIGRPDLMEVHAD